MSAARDAAFTALVDAQGTSLLRLATLLVGDPVSAEDLVQGVLERTYRRWSQVGQAASPEAYVRAAVVNAARRKWRLRTQGRESLVALVPEVPVTGGQSAAIVRHTLLEALQELTRQQRAVIVLRYFADQSEAEVARLLGCSTGMVKAHASRGLSRLRTDPRFAVSFDAVQERS